MAAARWRGICFVGQQRTGDSAGPIANRHVGFDRNRYRKRYAKRLQCLGRSRHYSAERRLRLRGLAGVNSTSLGNYLASSPLTVLSNTANLQAVRNNAAAITQIVFYQAGSLTIAPGLTITADRPCLVQIRELAGKNLELTISDPTQTQSQVNVTVTRHVSGTNTTWQAGTGLSTIAATLPSGVNTGQSVVTSLSYIEDLPTISFSQTAQTSAGKMTRIKSSPRSFHPPVAPRRLPSPFPSQSTGPPRI